MTEDVAVKMNGAALPLCIGQEFFNALGQPPAGIRDDQFHTLQAPIDQMTQERRPARLVLFGALANAQNLSMSLGIDGDRHQQGHIANFPAPGALHHDAIKIQVWVEPLDRPLPPGIDLRIDLTVEVNRSTFAGGSNS